MASGKIVGVGGTVYGTKNVVSCPNGGAVTEVGSITLSRGTWIVEASGWSPFSSVGQTQQGGTQVELFYVDAVMVTNSQLFDLVGVFTITNDTDTILLRMGNWESSSITTTTNYTFKAVKIA